MLIKVNDININYEIYGQGSPIILLHGNKETHEIFDKLIKKYILSLLSSITIDKISN